MTTKLKSYLTEKCEYCNTELPALTLFKFKTKRICCKCYQKEKVKSK